MRLLFDHNMPVSAADAFRENGHEVIFLKDVLPPDSKDPIVAATAEINEAVLVTFDRDFKKMASRISRGQARRFRNLSKIAMECKVPQAGLRLQKAMSFIEFEFETAETLGDKRMHLSIGDAVLRSHR